jgi:hypothetical protein
LTLSAGELLGLPAGWPDPVHHTAALRYLLAGLALLWCVFIWRGRHVAMVLGGVPLFAVAVGFWVAALGRPYGLFVDAQATRLAAEAGIAAASDAPSGFLADASDERRSWLWLTGTVPRLALLLPTLLPLLIVPGVALAVLLLWSQRERAALAASLWLAFSTGDLDAVGDVGFLTGLWSRPEGALAFAVAALIVLALGRLPLRPRFATVAMALGLVLLWLASPSLRGERAGGALPGLEVPLLLTFAQGLWMFLAWVGLWRRPDPTAVALVLCGAILVVVAGVRGFDPWGSHGLYRLGLLLAATAPLQHLARKLGALAIERWPGLARPVDGTSGAERLGLAVLLAVTLPGSFLVWWDPARLDTVARDSMEPISPVLRETMRWIRDETPADAVFLASAEYAPALPALSGRRVLRAPSLASASDDDLRVRLERQVLAGRDPGALAARFGLSHVFVTPGDFRDRGIRAPEELGERAALRLLHVNAEGYRVYALER